VWYKYVRCELYFYQIHSVHKVVTTHIYGQRKVG